MANLILPSRRIIQPQECTRIDWDNPITEGLRFAYDPMRQINVVSNAQATGFDAATMSIKPNATGLAVASNGSQSAGGNYFTPSEGDFVRSGKFSVATGWYTNTTANHLLICKWRGGVGGFEWLSQADTAYYAGVLTDGRNVNIKAGGSVSTSKINNFIQTNDGGSLVVYQDGYPVSLSDIWVDGTPTTPQVTTSNLEIGNSLNGSIAWCFGFSRVLSAAEARQLADNPWQILTSKKRVLYFDVLAGGGPSIHNDYITILHQLDQINNSSNYINSQSDVTVNTGLSQSGSLYLTEDSTFTVDSAVASTSSLVGGTDVDLGLLYNLNDQYLSNTETNEEATISGILNVSSTNNTYISSDSTIDTGLGVFETSFNNINPALSLPHISNISSASSLDVSGDINVSLIINSNYGIASTTNLIAKNNIELSTLVAASSLDNIEAFSELAIALSNSLNSDGGCLIDVETLLSFNNNAESLLLLEVSGNLVLSTESSILNNTTLSSNNSLFLSTLLVKELVSNIVVSSSIALDYEVTIINNGVNPLLKIRINSKEILIKVETKDLLLLSNNTSLLINKGN